MFNNRLLHIKLLIYNTWCTIWGPITHFSWHKIQWRGQLCLYLDLGTLHLCFTSHIGYQFASELNLRWWQWPLKTYKAGGHAIWGIIFLQLCLPIYQSRQKDHVVGSINKRTLPDRTQEESLLWCGTALWNIIFPQGQTVPGLKGLLERSEDMVLPSGSRSGGVEPK